MTTAFTLLFLAALALTTLLRLWLARRHLRHIAAHRGAVPEAFRDSIALAAHQRAADYTTARVRLGLLDVIVGALLVLALTLGGLLQAMHDGWTALGLGGIAHGLAFIAGLAVLSSLLDLPFSLWRTFVIEERFGFNKMTLRLFLIDLAKGALLGAAIGLPLLAAVLWLMAKMGEAWWLYVWLVWLGFNLLALAIYPTLIAPLFNKFTPLADAVLKERIEALLARCGFRASGLFVMDGSKRSAHGNAYFTGFGQAKRIVFFDTLLEKLAPGESKRCWRTSSATTSAATSGSASPCWRWPAWPSSGCSAGSSTRRGSTPGWACRARTPPPALVLFSLAVPLFVFPLAPLMSALSRRHEFEADAYAAEQTRAGDLVAALVKLYRDNAATLTPDPLYSAFYDSHPPAAARIAQLQAA
jgi:STE24 endopeptidase